MLKIFIRALDKVIVIVINKNSNNNMYCCINKQKKQLMKLSTSNSKLLTNFDAINMVQFNNVHPSKTSFTNINMSVSFKVFSVYNELLGYYSTILHPSTQLIHFQTLSTAMPATVLLSTFFQISSVVPSVSSCVQLNSGHPQARGLLDISGSK